MTWYFAACSCVSSLSHVTGCYVCDVFVATGKGSINMFHVLSALLCVFDAILFILCLEVMVVSWPTGSPALSLKNERERSHLLPSRLTPSYRPRETACVSTLSLYSTHSHIMNQSALSKRVDVHQYTAHCVVISYSKIKTN